MMSVLLIVHLSCPSSSQLAKSSQKKRPGLKLYIRTALSILPSTSSEVQLAVTKTLPEWSQRAEMNAGILVLDEKAASILAFFYKLLYHSGIYKLGRHNFYQMFTSQILKA